MFARVKEAASSRRRGILIMLVINAVSSHARAVALMAVCGSISACGTLGLPFNPNTDNEALNDVPQTVAARASGHTYVPIDPLGVSKEKFLPCSGVGGVLNAFPDNAVRIAIMDVSGKASVGGTLPGSSSSVGVAGSSYRVVIDYIMVDTVNEDMSVGKYAMIGNERVWSPLFEESEHALLYEVKRDSLMDDIVGGLGVAFKEVNCDTENSRGPTDTAACKHYQQLGKEMPLAEDVNFPVYVGVGIRITSNLTVLSGTVNLAGLGSIGAAADAKKLSGDLVIQTLGITGAKVTSALPLPSELNATTIQNAITAMATIKSALFSSGSDVVVTPRVVGFYNPLAVNTPQFVNAVVTQLGREKVTWQPICDGVPLSPPSK